METSEEKPDVSVVILTKNGAETIGRCLESLFNQESSHKFEVIAIDSGSTDGTLDILGNFQVRLERIPPSEFNFGGTKNLGFSISKGDIVVFLSQDAIPAGSNWLERMIAPFEDEGVMIVQGVDRSGRDGFYWLREGLFWYTSEIKRWLERYQQIGLSCVTIAIRKTAWEKVKFQTVPFGEDKLFQKNAVEAGMRIVLVDGTFVEHTHRYTCKSLRKRITNEGLGARISGEDYSFKDMIGDMLNLRIYRYLVRGMGRGEIRSVGELMFPVVRPFYVYKGARSFRE
ncbi:MAG: glycosyltransferase family 2 protein [Methanobacteriota archaeon]|nr:MAG: glycosyltransferase family 2 protein [Euryarchaeota archaeon]